MAKIWFGRPGIQPDQVDFKGEKDISWCKNNLGPLTFISPLGRLPKMPDEESSMRAIAEAKIKKDKIDSHILAQLLRADLIPGAYVPGRETRLFKEMICQRIFLVRIRTRLKNRIHVLLDRLHIPLRSLTDIFGKTESPEG